MDPDQPVSSIRSMEQVLSVSLARRQFNTLLLAIFAGLALLLAIVGIYGVMSYSVAERTQEIGIRMALGSSRRETLQLVFGQGLKLAAIGVVIGLGCAFGLTWLLSNMLFEMSATDPLTFGGVALVLLAVAGLASYLPARRATRVDPMIALRYE